VQIIQSYAKRPRTDKSRLLVLRFLVSPEELLGNETDGVVAMTLVKNRLVASPTGTLSPRPTEERETLPVGLVFRSVGYRGVPVPGVPFNQDWAVILNEKGRVLDPDTKRPRVGEYTAGWIKRGPTGVIGTNKPDAGETIACLLEDVAAGRVLTPAESSPEAAERLVRERQPRCLTHDDWLRLDAIETERGRQAGRPRVKFTRPDDMLAALGRT